MSGPLPGYMAPLTRPASWAYGRIIAARNARFDRGRGAERVDRPVISVGNITTGGTGKTPMVAWIADQLRTAGYCPVIAMRGYKAVNGISDEQAEYAQRLPGVQVLSNPNRAAALREFLPKNPQVDCVILDDGFQHRQLHRDLDLVLIDAGAATFAERMLPAGTLREPLENLRRAHGVIITHAEAGTANLQAQVVRFHGRPPLAMSKHVWRHLAVCDNRDASAGESEPVTWLCGKRVLVMAGVGKPGAVIQRIEQAGAVVAVNIPCADHQHYDRAKVAAARSRCGGCDAMVVTAKDWVKLRDLIDCAAWPIPIVVPRLEIDVFMGADALRQFVLSAVRRAPGQPAV